MQTITYTSARGETVTFGMNRPFIQGHIDGAGELKAEARLSPAAGLHGALDRGARLLPRTISVRGELIADGGRAELYRLREELAGALNPELGGYILYTNDHASRRIAAKPSGLPEWGVRRGDSLPFTASFVCPSPWWEDAEETALELGHGAGGLRFPLRLPAGFSRVWPERSINNSGHAETPVKISFSGPAANPAIINETTGRRIAVGRSLGEGDTLSIDTDPRSMGVAILSPDGDAEDATNWLSLDSSMLTLVPGVNVLRYSTGSDAADNRLVIRFRRRWAGV